MDYSGRRARKMVRISKFMPGDYVWVMRNNVPVTERVDYVTITINLNLVTNVDYRLADGREYGSKEVAATKEELREKIFGE